MPKKPLEGIRVVDFTWYYAGPQTSKVLADYGAEVVRIEGKSRPDLQRISPGSKDDVVDFNRNGDFNQRNTGKMSVTLNLAHLKGKEIAKRFVARADIVVESFAGGVFKRMGLGYEELKKVKPDIIMLSSCLQGQTGPHYTLPGFGTHLTALSGFNSITGWPDRGPASLGFYTNYIGARFMILAITAALAYQRRTGKGQYVDLAQYENGVHFNAPLLLDYAINKRTASRMGNHSLRAAPHGVYRCRGEDRWCAIVVSNDEEWQSFCQVIGNPAWTNEDKFGTILSRKKNEDVLDSLIEEWTITHTAEEVMTTLQAAGVPAGILATNQDILENDPQLKHRHAYEQHDHPEIGMHYLPAPPFKLTKSSYELRRSPLLGEHNEYALKELLGIPDEEVAQLVIEGVVE
jgi:benzylsuccinate CoA-transferase BbsF subunit